MYTNMGHGALMKNNNIDVKSRVYGRITASAPNGVWTVGDFADFGSRDAIAKALQRLQMAGKIRRVGPGLYDRPRTGRLTGKPAAPDYRAVIDAIARRDQARMMVDGMTAANDLGLSDAVPGRVTIHSDTRHKPIHLGNLTISFRTTSPSKLYWANRPAMRIVQALHWLKPMLEDADHSQFIRHRIRTLLAEPKKGPKLRADLIEGLSSLPTWMQNFLRDYLTNKDQSASPRPPQKRRPK
jgi:hypothetical protein